MLEMYDVEHIYVCDESIEQRGLSIEQLLIDVTLLNNKQLKLKLSQQDQLLSF